MNVAGVDISTHAIDIIKLPFDNNQAEWHRFQLHGNTALNRATSAVTHAPRGTYWDDVALVAIERPYGPGRDTLFHLHLIIGCIIAALPERLRPPWLLHPSEWRKACGLPGNASKEDVAFYVDRARAASAEGPSPLFTWPQDACDAYCIATAARNINQRGHLETTAAEA